MNNSFPEDNFQIEESKIDIKKIVLNYLRFWPWYLISVIIALSLAYIKLRYTQSTYTSKTIIKILSEEESNTISDLTSLASFGSSKVNIENEIAMLTSYRILEKVVKDQKLTQTYYNLGTVAANEIDHVPFEIYVKDSLKSGVFTLTVKAQGIEILDESSSKKYIFKGGSTFGGESHLPFDLKLNLTKYNSKDPIRIVLNTLKNATLHLQSKLIVKNIGKKSDLISIVITGAVKSKSERILNSLVRIYGEEGVDEKRLVDRRTVDFIDQRFVSLIKELDTIENSKKEFKQNNQLFDIENNAVLEIQKETQTEEELYELENQLLISKMLLDSLLREKEMEELLPNNIGIESGAINGLIENYNQQVLKYQKLIKSGGVNNPMVKNAEQTMQATRQSITQSVNGYVNQLKSSLYKLEKRNTAFKKSVESLPLKEKTYREIQRKQEIKESLFLLLLEKREASAIKYAVKEPTIKVVDYALTSNNPTSPNRKSIYLFSIFIGLLLPIGCVYLVFLFNTKIESSKDIEDLIKNVPVLSNIPYFSNYDSTVSIHEGNNRSILKESFRTLLTNLNFIIPNTNDGVGKTILVTSSIKGEGKTLVSYNLASELAEHNNKVIIIGADLRNPQLHKYLNTGNINNGLSKYLSDDSVYLSDLDIHTDENVTNLEILLAGVIPPNPTSLFSNKRFSQLLTELKKNYDFIIIDSAPTLLVSDTLIFGRLAEATVYVTRSRYTEKQVVEYSKKLVEDAKLNNVGYVLNGVDTSTYGYGYNYEYAYTYGYTYDDNDEGQKKWYQFWKRS